MIDEIYQKIYFKNYFIIGVIVFLFEQVKLCEEKIL